jgi:hypothetical protein
MNLGVQKCTQNAPSALGEDYELRMALEDIASRENRRGGEANQELITSTEDLKSDHRYYLWIIGGTSR